MAIKSPKHAEKVQAHNASRLAHRYFTEDQMRALEPYANRIRKRLSSASKNAYQIGREINEVVGVLKGDKHLMAWLKLEFPNEANSTLDNYRNAAKVCDKYGFTKFGNLPFSAIYELARNDIAIPDTVRRMFDNAETQKVSLKQVRYEIKQALPPPPPPPEPDTGEPTPNPYELFEALKAYLIDHLWRDRASFPTLINMVKYQKVRLVVHVGNKSGEIFNASEWRSPCEQFHALPSHKQGYPQPTLAETLQMVKEDMPHLSEERRAKLIGEIELRMRDPNRWREVMNEKLEREAPEWSKSSIPMKVANAPPMSDERIPESADGNLARTPSWAD